MKALATIRHHALLASCIAALGATSNGSQEVGAWRSVWGITLSADEGQGVPRSFTLQLRNLGDTTLQGKNAVFTIYVGDLIYGWAVDRKLQSKIFTIPPGGVVTEKVLFADLQFGDFRGNDLDADSVVPILRAERWQTRVTILDELTPKSPFESNLTAWSNSVRFNEKL